MLKQKVFKVHIKLKQVNKIVIKDYGNNNMILTILEQIEKNRILDFYFVEIKRRYRMVLFLILSKICCLLSVRMINLSRSM